MAKLLTTSAALLALLLVSCTETFVGVPESSPPPGDTILHDTTWFPMSVGSYWTYASGSNTMTVRVEKDTLIEGLIYRVFSNTDGPSRYFRREKWIVFEWGLEGIEGEVTVVEENPGAQWEYIVVAGGFPVFQNRWETEGIDIRRFAGGEWYEDVLHIRRRIDRFEQSRGDWERIAELNYYYALGVGLVELEVSSPAFPTSPALLQEYFIAP